MKLKALVLAAVMTLGMASTAFAGWRTGALRTTDWWYETDGKGGYLADCWAWIDGNGDGIAECYYFAKGNGTKNLERMRMRTPTSQNLAGMAVALKGCDIADVNMIVLTIDPCISCTER